MTIIFFFLVLLAFLYKSTFSEQHTKLSKCGLKVENEGLGISGISVTMV